jgi:RNA polymerase sigma factor (sigma-70 family)
MDRSGLRHTLHHLSTVVAPPGARDRTDGELLHAYCAQRDEAAFTALVQRHSRLVLAVCDRVLRQREDKEDVFQATFLALARDAASVRRRESISGWLHGVARHIALDARRAATRRHRYEGQAMSTATPNPAWEAAWHEVQLALDQAIQRLPDRYREPFVLCCLEDLSRAEAAARLGIKEGTVGSRLTEARRRLRDKLARRGLDLTAVLAATAVAAGVARADLSPTLTVSTARVAAQMAGGQALTPDLVSNRILSLVRGVPKAMLLTTRMMATLFLIALAVVGSAMAAVAYHQQPRGAPEPRPAPQAAANKSQPNPAQAEAVVWKEEGMIRTPGCLPWSAAYAPNGKMLIVGDTSGNVRAFDPTTRAERWKADINDNFAAVAYSADGQSVVVTVKNGVRFLDAATGQLGALLEEKDSSPRAVAVFQDRDVIADQRLRSHKVVFGNRQRYVVKTWIGSAAPSTISLSTSAKDTNGADAFAVPLAVDPEGSSVILTGPIDRDTGKNILWAWVAGDNGAGSPGNRVLKGHDAVVVSAAWSRDGKTAVTGDAAGRVIVWDAQTMKESHRIELGERAAALALSSDSKKLAAVAIGKQAKFYAWDSTAPKKLEPIHTDSSDYAGPIQACLAFSPDGQQLVGSAINTVWLTRLGELIGTLHVWKAMPAR